MIYHVKEGRHKVSKPRYAHGHRHYSRVDLQRHPDASDFQGQYTIDRVKRCGLIVEPLLNFVVHLMRLTFGLKNASQSFATIENVQR